jgi:hypothetical protein
MLHWVWLSDRPTVPSSRPPATAPRRTRHREPTLLAGLTTKPLCDACAHGSALRPPAPSSPPPRLTSTRGRRRQGDTSRPFCPHPACAYRGWVGWGNLRATGHPNGAPWRQLLGVVCRRSFLETLGPLLYGKRTSVERIVRVLACWAAGLGIRGTARGFEVDPNPVLQWRVEAAEQLQALSRHVRHDGRVRQVQVDALCALRSAVKAGAGSEAEAIARLERSPQWVWVAMAPERKVVLVIAIGERTLARAQRVVHQVAQVLAPDGIPVCCTAGFREYMPALLAHSGHWVQPLRRQEKGPYPKPRGMPLPQLRYAQGGKTVRRRRLVRVSHRGVFGTCEAVQQGVAACGWQLNPAFVARLNRTMRQHGAAVGRRVSPRCKDEDGWWQQLALYHTSYNFCLPHTRLRQPLPQPLPTNGSGAAQQWRPCTPAMAAGLTDQVWTRREVLLYRVPPWPQPARVGASRGGGAAGEVT